MSASLHFSSPSANLQCLLWKEEATWRSIIYVTSWILNVCNGQLWLYCANLQMHKLYQVIRASSADSIWSNLVSAAAATRFISDDDCIQCLIAQVSQHNSPSLWLVFVGFIEPVPLHSARWWPRRQNEPEFSSCLYWGWIWWSCTSNPVASVHNLWCKRWL